LRQRICLLDYAPASRLREEDLAEEFGVSRTPIRRVLVKLEAEGLLRSVHGVGTMVTDIDVDELAQVYGLRIELAELVGRLSPVTVDAPLIARFHEVRARCDRLLREGDPREFARINMDFFHLFNSLTSNEPLREISERLYYQTTRIWLKTASRLKGYEQLLDNEFIIFQREVADITEGRRTGRPDRRRPCAARPHRHELQQDPQGLGVGAKPGHARLRGSERRAEGGIRFPPLPIPTGP
jgi:DNA-binding GntR family transcriptional regulator